MQITPQLFDLMAFLIVTIGATVHGSVGLGMGLVAAPVLLLIDPMYVPGPLLVCAIVLTVMMALREKHSLDYYGLWWGYAGRVIGTIIALTILVYIPRQYITLLSAVLILIAVILSVFKIRTKLSIPALLGAGSASGIMSTLASVGGPPLALLYQYEKGAKLRATMSGFFILGSITSIVGLVLVGEFSLSHFRASLLLIPGVVLGYYLSSYAIRVLDLKKTRTAVLIMSVLSILTVITRLVPK